MPKRSKRTTKRRPKETESTGDVLDLKGAADFLKVSKPTFYRWLAQRKIKGFKAGQQWRFYRVDLERFLKELYCLQWHRLQREHQRKAQAGRADIHLRSCATG